MQDNTQDQEPFTWRAGMHVYRAGISTFFHMGGLAYLKRKYKMEGIDERTGQLAGLGIPEKSLWVHAVSVGEAQSASAILRKIKRDPDIGANLPCVVSTVTKTGREMAGRLAGDITDKMFYSPWDAPKFITSALDTVRPAAYIAMETERWPEMLSQLKRRGIPAFLANGRLSEASLAKLKHGASFWRGVLSCFTRLLVRFDEDRDHYLELGVPNEKIIVTGDCKVDALLDRREAMRQCNEAWDHLRRGQNNNNNNNPLFVAGSTHTGEDEILLAAFMKVREKHPGARLVIVPRHPERALMVVAATLPYPDLKADLLSNLDAQNRLNSPDWDIVVVDRIGILLNLYAAADAAFVGGSLVPKGGQNPMEPALFGVLTTHGPDVRDFPDTERMDKMGASCCVHNDTDLANIWTAALEPENRERVRAACQAYYDTLGGAAVRTWEIVKQFIK